MFRIPLGKDIVVDNFHAGGIAAAVDMLTGVLGDRPPTSVCARSADGATFTQTASDEDLPGALEPCGFSKCSASGGDAEHAGDEALLRFLPSRPRPDEAPAAMAPSPCRRARAPRPGIGSRRRRPPRRHAGCGSSGVASWSRRWSRTRSARPSRSRCASHATARRISTFCLSAMRKAPTLACPLSSKPHCEVRFSYWVRICRRCTSP